MSAENASTDWTDVATQLRVDSIRSTTAAGSGHPTSSLSAADLMAVLLVSHLRYDPADPHSAHNDRLIFSKGHAAPLLYAMLKAMGAISDDELMSLRKRGSRIEGHPAPTLPFIEIATGSLGQGLPAAVGMALAAGRLDRSDARFWVLLGDSEAAEGSVYEAFEAAAFYGLSRIVGVLDMNRLGQRGPTMLQWNGEAYASRARAFGWDALTIDGHDTRAIDEAYSAAERSAKPTLIVARTKKGAGVSFLADKEGWHGKALSAAEAERALAELDGGRNRSAVVRLLPPRSAPPVPRAGDGATRGEARAADQATQTPPKQSRPKEPALPRYAPGDSIATRAAFGDALAAVGAVDGRVVVLDGEVSNSTHTDRFARAQPQRFFEMYIAEQQMVAAAVGMQALGWTPVAATFAAFLTRAFDQVRMAAVSGATMHVVGSHAGVSIGEDGPSQMGLEDLAMLRAVHGSTVLYPCCANATARLVAEMIGRRGIHYLRTTREKTRVLYPATEPFPIGGSKVLRRSDRDAVAIVAAGVTVHEALVAHGALEQRGISARVVDLYSVKPVDRAALREAARDCRRGLVVVEDHHPEGGLADAVAEAFDGETAPAIVRLAVRIMPGSATPAEQLDAAGIGARAIADAAERLASTGQAGATRARASR
ncbi:MAG TPA: transketolase [Polyangiaceae bacterium]|nr:transketolase [Polyangiaceae bacterium]